METVRPTQTLQPPAPGVPEHGHFPPDLSFTKVSHFCWLPTPGKRPGCTGGVRLGSLWRLFPLRIFSMMRY